MKLTREILQRLTKDLAKTLQVFIACPTLCMLVMFSGCSAQRPVEMGDSFSPSCRLVTGISSLDKEISIGVDSAVLSGMTTISEMVPAMFSHRSTLAVLDCEGTLHPGGATGWEKIGEGKSWRFALHQDLYLTDASALPAKMLTASELAERWKRNTDAFPMLEKIEAVSTFEIVFHLKEAQPDFPLFLISPHFSLDTPGNAGPGMVTRLAASADARDVLEDDSGMVGIITMDRDVIEYASSRPEWIVQALPWDRIYMLVTKSPVPAATDEMAMFPESIAASFVNDVVQNDARVYETASWLEETKRCAVSFGKNAGGDLNPLNDKQNILYLKGDETAKVLAERMAALASGAISVAGSDSLSALLPNMGSASYTWSAVSMPSSSGFDGVYIVSLPRQVFDPCLAMENLREMTPWLFDKVSGQPYTFIPLIDTRPALILRRGTAHVDVDGFGRLYISRPSGGNGK